MTRTGPVATVRSVFFIATVLILVLTAASGSAQRSVPFQGDRPIAPNGIKAVPLPTSPVEFDTAEDQRIRVSVVARGLANPWSLAFLPDGSMLVTERPGRLRIVRNGTLDPTPVAGTPQVASGFLSGLMEVSLHPRFAENRFVYLTYTKKLDEKQSALALARGKWDGKGLTETRDLFVTGVGTGAAARLAWAKDGTLFMSTGGLADGAQDPNSHAGKVLHLRDDGSVPSDNPFVGQPNHKPEVYSLGHRNSIGLAVNPVTGALWQNEHGPNGGDEMNVIKPGANYGWPIVSFGRTYSGPWHSKQFQAEGIEQPAVVWIPSIAISGLSFYTGDKLAKWKGDVFVGAMRTGEIPNTGHLERVLINEQGEELRRESLLTELRQRIRDVRQGPDELLYLVTDHASDGAILRIEPAGQ